MKLFYLPTSKTLLQALRLAAKLFGTLHRLWFSMLTAFFQMTGNADPQINEKRIGVLLIVFAIGFNFWYMGLPTFFLNLGLLISLLIWLNFKKNYRRKLSWLYLVGILFQLMHFLEEYFTGFYKSFPLLFNSRPWAGHQFILFNTVWIIVFLTSLIGTLKGVSLSYIFWWFFLIIGCIGNAVLHIGLTVLRQNYVSGTATAFLLLTVGLVMINEISRSPDKMNS